MYIETIAIIIGVSYYLQDDMTPLPAAEIDAVNFDPRTFIALSI